MTTHTGAPRPRENVRSVGVEEELLLVDPVSGVAVARAAAVVDSVRDADGGEGPGGAVGGELMQEQVEVDTPPRQRLEDVRGHLARQRERADAAARSQGARAVALATSPLPGAPHAAPGERYQRMVAEFGMTADEQLVCGTHVHVGVDGPEEGVAVLDRIRVWLPVLTGLSASSPFWQGRDSGYASFRSQAWNRWPSAGPVDVFGSAAAYRATVDSLLATGTVLDDGMLYFDARLSPQFPTVEIRVADVNADLDDTVAVVALCRALVETASRSWRVTEPAPDVGTAVLRVASWRAGRSGVEGDLLHPLRQRPAPAGEVVAALLSHVDSALRDAGDHDVVHELVDGVLARGGGARRQREVLARSGELSDVVADVVERTHRP